MRKIRFLVIWIEKTIRAKKGESICGLFFKDFLKMGGLRKRKGEVLFLEGFDVIVFEWLSLKFVCLFLWWGCVWKNNILYEKKHNDQSFVSLYVDLTNLFYNLEAIASSFILQLELKCQVDMAKERMQTLATFVHYQLHITIPATTSTLVVLVIVAATRPIACFQCLCVSTSRAIIHMQFLIIRTLLEIMK